MTDLRTHARTPKLGRILEEISQADAILISMEDVSVAERATSRSTELRSFKKSPVGNAARDSLEVHAALDNVHAMIWFDLDGTILDANENFLSALGYGFDELKGQHHRMFLKREYAASSIVPSGRSSPLASSSRASSRA